MYVFFLIEKQRTLVSDHSDFVDPSSNSKLISSNVCNSSLWNYMSRFRAKQPRSNTAVA